MPRPSRPRLSRDGICATALGLVDETGHFTVNGVAARLGVRPSSIYNHVSGREEIVEGLRGMLVPPRSALPSEEVPWEEAVAEWARQYRNALSEHPRVIPVLVSQTVTDPATIALYERVARVLERAGFAGEELVTAVTVLDSFILGAALDATAPIELWAAGTREDSALARAAAATSSRGRERADRTFERGLRGIITSLRDGRAAAGDP
ncbi:TetR family transcriptional regulator [Haloactinospora alba]|uniref:TetR family transcriptional regulator n=1 Tax=Haloactinospora alba TaxID=405555 RepID=A0A543NP07_9ACTN|nr:TetR/AcrR family transcriptional regulator C-terminal domain-containing protein [Haloactinospora alba]TQN33563.1 TetR family transcriptional regulator [Haloactinospora alba]